jgi:hypothetical protein
MARQTHLIKTPAIPPAMTANILNAKSHSTCGSKKTSQPLSISNLPGEPVRYAVRIGKFGEPSLICNLR